MAGERRIVSAGRDEHSAFCAYQVPTRGSSHTASRTQSTGA
jgi:hypothetical protein